MKDNYLELVDALSPKEDVLKNAILTFFSGGILGALSQLLLSGYVTWFSLSNKEAGIWVTLTLIIISSIFSIINKW